MFVRTPADLGAIVREKRRELNLGQAELAERVGVSRQWLIGVERGRARAELGLVLRTLDALGVRLDIRDKSTATEATFGPDIDAIVSAARKPPL